MFEPRTSITQPLVVVVVPPIPLETADPVSMPLSMSPLFATIRPFLDDIWTEAAEEDEIWSGRPLYVVLIGVDMI